MPPGKTDQVQPIDRGLGRHVKIYMGQEEDEWLEDDDNLTKWEDNKLTACDRRVLIATWFSKACKRALEGRAKRKYFEHAGALMTADGTDDNLIKLEGVPKGENFTFMDDVPAAGGETIAEAGAEPEPEDVAPRREEADGNEDGLQLDDEDDADEDDAPPAPCEPPAGFATRLSAARRICKHSHGFIHGCSFVL